MTITNNQIEAYRQEAKNIYAEVLKLEEELKLTGVQHKRQALRTRISEARLQWQVANLHRENEELKADALGKAMASEVRAAQRTKENVEEAIKERAETTIRRLNEMSEKLQAYTKAGNTEYILYTLMNDLPVMLGNSSLDTLSRNRAELATAEMILRMAKPAVQE